MKKYFEIEFDDDYDLIAEEIEDALHELIGKFFDVREISKIDILTHENTKCKCSIKVTADGNKGMERG